MILDGKMVLEAQGNIIREMSSADYSLQKVCELRGLSGEWMIFYSMAVTIIIGAIRLEAGNFIMRS